VAVTAADLTSPTGELQTAWFSDLPGNLAIRIDQGEGWVPEDATLLQADAVVTAYVYVRGFRDVLLRAARDPNSISIDKGDISISFTDGQRKLFAEQVSKWEVEFDAAVAATAVVTVVDAPPRASFAQPIVRSF
jgi:hypothetical protein